MPYELSPLPYALDALEPHIDAATMGIHHGKHHNAYVTNLNKALEGQAGLLAKPIEQLLREITQVPENLRQPVINNGGGHANHTLFWNTMGKGKGGAPSGPLSDALAKTFGSIDKFKETFANNGMTRFGSGWSWLAVDGQKQLKAYSLPNQDSPYLQGHTPILGLDVWEHAYYLKYQNRRADYIAAWWSIVDWGTVGDLFAKAMK